MTNKPNILHSRFPVGTVHYNTVAKAITCHDVERHLDILLLRFPLSHGTWHASLLHVRAPMGTSPRGSRIFARYNKQQETQEYGTISSRVLFIVISIFFTRIYRETQSTRRDVMTIRSTIKTKDIKGPALLTTVMLPSRAVTYST